jgi:hypothetical protein
MSARLLVASFGLTLLACGPAGQTSGRYGGPGYAAAAVGVGAVGAVASRAAGGCYAQCIAGTHCNRATGLCVSHAEPHPGPAPPETLTHEGHAPLTVRSTSYEPGHEYEIPPVIGDDAGCAPASDEMRDGGVACEMEGGTL